jgi:uncharacterized repeat protein (TIGR03803 family)
MIKAGGVCLLWATAAVALPAPTFTLLHTFTQKHGAGPEAALIQATDGNFYGTTIYGGINGDGTIFRITPSGRLTTIYSFCSQPNCMDGAIPYAGLVQGTDGNFYGTTREGGPLGYGTVFKITPGGTLTTLHSFDCTDGCYPGAPLVRDTEGNFYGTTLGGGSKGFGTVFKITSGGKLTTEYSFCSQSYCTDGTWPGSLVQATDGDFYGTTFYGGSRLVCGRNGCGTIFKITPSGALTTLHKFNYTTGSGPNALIQANNGKFYGTTYTGGANGIGTVFKITPRGTLTTLHSFDGLDGSAPGAGLVQATNGKFYGTTASGGATDTCNPPSGCGTVFKITGKGTLTTLYSFCAPGGGTCPEGYSPAAALVQGTDGKFYGTTVFGGNYNHSRPCMYGCGTVFRLSVGLK